MRCTPCWRLSPAEVERCLGPALPDLARLLPELGAPRPRSGRDPEQEKRRIFSRWATCSRSLAARQPLLLVVEDLHWADDTSLELLAVLARRIPRERILLLGTYRDDEVSRGPRLLAERARSEPTGWSSGWPVSPRDEVAAMLRAIFELDRPVRSDFLQAIYALTEGNPFFIEELAAVAARPMTSLGDGSWEP